MQKKGKLTKAERLEIKILLNKEYSQRSIARALERSPNTISYEIKNNSTCGIYNPHKAQTKVSWRRTHIKRDWKKIDQDTRLRTYITDKLKASWNPDEISGRMKEDKEPFYASKTAIYEWLYSARGQYWCKYLYSKQYSTKKHVKKTERVMIPNRVSYELRPLGATNRTRFGHLESDSIVSGKNGTGGVSVLQDRKSRYVDARLIRSMSCFEVTKRVNDMLIGTKALSITTDNGIEYKQHQNMNVPVYFCDPYSSHQKGSVENVNKMIRQFFPKGTNFANVTPEELKRVIDLINKKPRKILGYKTAEEVMLSRGMMNCIKREVS